ncbi:MAG TPA: ATP-binding cassette domain-containing protein, partial [Pseudonocardiaceae bacterium]
GTGIDPATDGARPAQRPASDLLRLGCGRFRPEVCQAYVQVATTGRATPEVLELLRQASPVELAGNITAPTMLVQGLQDTLFGLDQADATARQVADAGGTIKVVWYNGGHDGGMPGRRLRDKIMTWFDFHLAGRGEDPGTDFEYAVRGSFSGDGLASVRTVYARTYPGLAGGTPASRRTLPLSGGTQPVFVPPGGSPASLSSVPGLGSLSAAASAFGGIAVDVPGQAATFATAPLDDQLLLAGSARARLRVAAVPGTGTTEAVLFAKLYDVGPDGARSLPGGAVSPLRVTDLPADGSAVEVTVALPGVVRQIEPGHHLEVVVSTTDQAYATPVVPTAYTVAAAGDLSVPFVPGDSSADSTVPRTPLIGIGVLAGTVLLAALVAVLRRRRVVDVRPELVDVPLVIEDLGKVYAGGFKAVDGLSFRVEAGQVLGLLGPNGAGKTTALRMLMGLIRPDGGEIRVFGHRVRPGDPVLSRLGAFVEGPGFLPHLSGIENLRLYWAATGRPAEDARMDEALEVAGLGAAVRRRVGTYSQGMRQRLAIAQAMLGLPDLLVLDEPTNGLDPPQIREMRDVLRRYAATGRTVLVSSHLLAEVEQTCTHVVVMHKGRLVASGPVAEIVAGGGQASFRVDTAAATVTAASLLRSLDGVTGVEIEGDVVHADLGGMPRSEAVRALVRTGVAVEQAGPRRRLEDAFLQLVGEETGS